MTTVLQVNRSWLFFTLVAALVLVEYGIARNVNFSDGDVVALAVTVDLVAGVPLLGYLLVVRPRRAPIAILAPLFLLGVLLANLILPEAGERYLNWIELALPLLEIGLLLYAASRVRRIHSVYREIRPAAVYATDALEESLRRVLGDTPAIPILMTEFSLLFYAVGGWFIRPYGETSQRAGRVSYSTHVKSGYGIMALALIGLSLVEIPLVHLVVSQFNNTLAWILTLLTLYTVVWLTGDYHAIRLHPIVIDETHLHLRAGMRWRVSVPRAQIREIRTLTLAERNKKEALDLSVTGNARLLLRTNEPVTVRGLFGIRRVTETIAFAIDDEAGFLELIR